MDNLLEIIALQVGPAEAIAYLFVVMLIIIILSASIKVVREYERGIIFRLGRFIGAKGPGLFFLIPIIDRFVKVDLRTVVVDIPRQKVVTKDNVSVDVDAAVYYRVIDPAKAILQVENYTQATNLLAQTTLRDVLGQVELDELLTRRDELGKRISGIVDELTEPWGIKVSMVALKDITMPETMVRAIAKQAEAEREKRSRIIIAEGELMASEKLAAAAKQYSEQPISLRLRELQTLTEIARERNLVVVTTTTDASSLASMVGLIKGMGKEDKGPKE
ncbi:MAG: slipin family protein [Nitrososphaerota archaeon]|nr:slipin family protein [Aigarchaeota archaeon]MDW8076938.1 slipin family protein [Nitrososphaerota archaeon]